MRASSRSAPRPRADLAESAGALDRPGQAKIEPPRTFPLREEGGLCRSRPYPHTAQLDPGGTPDFFWVGSPLPDFFGFFCRGTLWADHGDWSAEPLALTLSHLAHLGITWAFGSVRSRPVTRRATCRCTFRPHSVAGPSQHTSPVHGYSTSRCNVRLACTRFG